ncbi:MAG: tyrosine-type recombinase/integrase [Acidimicrobiales bacterium]
MTDKTLRARIALSELEAMGLTVDDLLGVAGRAGTPRAPGVTVADYVPVVAASYQPRSRRTYNSYWRLTVELLGDLAVDRVTVDDLMCVADEASKRAKGRRVGSDGRASRESCIAALRAVFTRAHRSGLIPTNPALLIEKPRRLPNRRRALTQAELDELWAAAATTTKDPALDLLLLRFHLESGARRMGAINLRLKDLDLIRQSIWLREKFGTEREQPISRSLLRAVADLAAERGSTRPEDHALVTLHRAHSGLAPVTDRTYDRLFTTVQQHVGWAERTPLTAHVLRHTAITAVERVAGFAVAQRFAGHSPSSVTGTYTKADIAEVAAAVALLTGEPHPLAV